MRAQDGKEVHEMTVDDLKMLFAMRCTPLSKDERIVALDDGFWHFVLNRDEAKDLGTDTCGKWMSYFDDFDFAADICRKAVESGAVVECKCTSRLMLATRGSGVICFYVNGDDTQGHHKVLSFMMEHGLIRRTKSGRLYDIGFKFDSQTRAGEYGEAFVPKMTLSDFVNLETGEFL